MKVPDIKTALPGPQVSLPMTYLHQGRQFIVVGSRGNANQGAQLVAFALPLPEPAGGRGGRGGDRHWRCDVDGSQISLHGASGCAVRSMIGRGFRL